MMLVHTSMGLSFEGNYYVKKFEKLLEPIEIVPHPEAAFIYTADHAENEIAQDYQYYRPAIETRPVHTEFNYIEVTNVR